LPDGTLLIDNPGMRELQVWGSDEAVEDTFADVDALATACRFTDCTHGTEPGCAIRPAVESGELAPERFAAYEKLRGEYAELDRRRAERERASGYRKIQRARRRDKGDE
jgi:ribosome biogenesis GTPase